MLYIDIFLTCHHAILNGILITRQSKRDKEYHFQDWFSARLTNLQATIPFNFEQPGRNTYPDFRIIQNPEGYEIKGLEYPGRYKDYDSNSQVPRGYHNGMTVFYVFGRYPKNADSQYPVHDLVICHGDFLNADRNYIHKNKSFRGFGSYGDILIRDRKMYVAPTPFGLLNGVESQVTMILPAHGSLIFLVVSRIDRTLSIAFYQFSATICRMNKIFLLVIRGFQAMAGNQCFQPSLETLIGS